MRSKVKLAIIGAGVAAVAAAAVAPAMASVNVQLSTSSGTRTLNLYQPDGTTPLTSTDLTSGSSNFIAQVVDNSYTNNGFKVFATMSNLYQYNTGTNQYTCGSMVPSSAIGLNSPTGLLSVAGVNANLTPVFNIVGTLTPLNTAGLTSDVPINLNVNGLLPAGQNPLSQSQLTGSSVTNLAGSALTTVESKLPVSLGTTGLGGNFQTADVHPVCDTGASGASQVSIMNAAADPGGVLSDIQALIQSTVVPSTATPTVSQLISSGYLSSSDVSTALQTVSSLVNQLGLGGLTTDLSSIESTLTSSLSSLTLLPNSLIQSGNYSSSPTLSVTLPQGVSAGTYKGVMTVTLVDQ